MSLINKEVNILKAYDRIIESTNTNQNTNIKIQLTSTIVLKQIMLTELTGVNYDIQDGLVNGAEGIFRASTTFENGTIWIEFDDLIVGTIQWKKNSHLFK